MITTRLTALLAVSLVVVACHREAAPPVVEQRPDRDPGAAITAIRAAGAKAQSSVEVQPLRDPAVEGLLKQARELEAQGQPAAALDAVHRAQQIAGATPELLQFEAELQIEQRHWPQAEAAAKRSWDAGPKVGALCARNQQTLVEARSNAGDTAGADVARQQVAACTVQAPPRY